MALTDFQQGIIDTVNVVVDGKINSLQTPQTQVGLVKQDPDGFEVLVDFNGTERKCTLPEHLHDWISKDDIVFATDMMGNGIEWVVTGSSGSVRDQSLVINDEDTEKQKGRLVSGVTKFEDENGDLTDNELIVGEGSD